MNALTRLQQWYESQCDGYWEHQYGVRIKTLDNPGWRVSIDLAETTLEGQPFQEISDLDADRDWIRCWIENGKFESAGGSQKLEEIINLFLDWAASFPNDHPVKRRRKRRVLNNLTFEGSDLLAARAVSANHFVDVFQRLLNRENVDLMQEDLSFIFEMMASALFARSTKRKETCFDGVDDLSVVIRKPKQIEFHGKMWILENEKNFSEPFKARVTDKRITSQGIWIAMWVGADKAEGDLSLAFSLLE